MCLNGADRDEDVSELTVGRHTAGRVAHTDLNHARGIGLQGRIATTATDHKEDHKGRNCQKTEDKRNFAPLKMKNLKHGCLSDPVRLREVQAASSVTFSTLDVNEDEGLGQANPKRLLQAFHRTAMRRNSFQFKGVDS
jgi:hypothetical protein